MILETIPQIQSLSKSDKLTLVDEIWDSITAEPGDSEVDPAIIDLLDQRMQEYRANPSAVVSWEEVKSRILQSNQT